MTDQRAFPRTPHSNKGAKAEGREKDRRVSDRDRRWGLDILQELFR